MSNTEVKNEPRFKTFLEPIFNKPCEDYDDECPDVICPHTCWQHDPSKGFCVELHRRNPN